MKKKLQLIAMIGGMAIATNAFSQRYLAETFTAVAVTPSVTYGTNISVLTGTPASQPLIMDVYQPVGDVQATRPLIIILHAGSFLPSVASGLAIGKRTDSSSVYLCRLFAKRGYVAVSMDYRLGWNALSTNQDARTGTLLNAVYRAIQDAKTCVRYFRNDAATTNTYKIDVNKICVGGFGSGGYVATAYASLNKAAELQLTKFINFSLTPPAPYVDQTLSGNFDGTDATTLNTPNYATQSSSINVAFSIAGAAGDSSWIEAGEVPIICMQGYKDPYAPYRTANVIVPATGQFVVEASGSYDITRRAKRLGNNAIFTNSVFNDVFTTKANANSNGIPALYPFITNAPGPNLSCTGANANAQLEQGSPWEWWNEPVFIASYNAFSGTTNGAAVACRLKLDNPDMSPAKGRAYVDTIQGFLSPRLVCALGLAGCQSSVGFPVNSINGGLSIYPNPVTSEINYSLPGGNTIRRINLMDATGRVVVNVEGLNDNSYQLNREQLKTGLYFTTIELDNKQVITKKLIID
jgi:alpha/beta superfamily hydrolase